MSVIRQENTSDVIGPTVLLLWRKKWWVIIPAVLAFIAVFIVLRMVPERYKVSAEIIVNRLPAVPDQEGPSAGTVTRLLENTAVLAQVRNDYIQAFDVETAPPIEKWVEQFEVETEILQDTSVRKEISPAITLTVESEGTSQTQFIMQSWLARFMEHFGNYATEEAVMKRDAMRSAIARVEGEIAEVEEQVAAYDAAAPYHRKMLAEPLELLTPARLFLRDQSAEDDSVRVDLNLYNQRPKLGLLTRLSELQIDMDSGDAPLTASQTMAAYRKAIAEAETSVTAAQNAYAEIRTNILRYTRRLQELSSLKNQMLTSANKYEVAATLYRQPAVGELPAGGDIRALSTPVMPDKRIWPKRTITAAGVASGIAILAAALLLASSYLGSLRQRQA